MEKWSTETVSEDNKIPLHIFQLFEMEAPDK